MRDEIQRGGSTESTSQREGENLVRRTMKNEGRC